ncbi:hypothetical protein BKA81DRAFT_199660 [Phyllosticta paracitricarpa]
MRGAAWCCSSIICAASLPPGRTEAHYVCFWMQRELVDSKSIMELNIEGDQKRKTKRYQTTHGAPSPRAQPFRSFPINRRTTNADDFAATETSRLKTLLKFTFCFCLSPRVPLLQLNHDAKMMQS